MSALDILCPFHVVINASGTIERSGHTFSKMIKGAIGRNLFDVLETCGPRQVTSFDDLCVNSAKTLKFRLKKDTKTELRTVVAYEPTEETVILNFSFGVGLERAVRKFSLTHEDFAPTDGAIEMLYLIEAKKIVLDANRATNLKLYGAKLQAEQAAATDTLTGLFNRRALETHIDALLRVNKRFTLAQMDLDFFKTVNDTHGHAAGDHVLKEISKILKYETRRDDFIVRLGGDEFVMVFDGLTDIDELGQICQRIISAAQVPIPFNSTFCNVSCSIGLFCVFSGDLQADDILHNADMALYQAKAAGRSTFKVF